MHLKELNVNISMGLLFGLLFNWDERFLRYSIFSALETGVIFARITNNCACVPGMTPRKYHF